MASKAKFTTAQEKRIQKEVARRAALAVREIERITDRQISGRNDTEGTRDRFGYDRDNVLRLAMQAWRESPIARRIVDLTSEYVVGAGISIESKHKATDRFIKQFWNHRQNRMPIRVLEMCDELTRAGELFPILSTNVDGMSYIRLLPAENIDYLITRDNDVEQLMQVVEKQTLDSPSPRTWDAYDETTDAPDSEGNFKPVILQYAINRPVAAQHGESDLAPMLKWLSRFAGWLEDRVRLNHWRQVFMYIVRGVFATKEERQARQNELNADPPKPGSTLVTDQNEAWGTLSANLDAFDAQQDGIAIKKMIATGAGVPLHFLAEPEGSNKSTAESAGGPTFRHYQKRQVFFLWMIEDLLRVAIRRRNLIVHNLPKAPPLTVRGADISARDNAALSVAATHIVTSFIRLWEYGLVDDEELIRLSYTFAGEVVDVQALLEKVVPPRYPPSKAKAADTDTKVDTETGDVTGTGALQSGDEEETSGKERARAAAARAQALHPIPDGLTTIRGPNGAKPVDECEAC